MKSMCKYSIHLVTYRNLTVSICCVDQIEIICEVEFFKVQKREAVLNNAITFQSTDFPFLKM